MDGKLGRRQVTRADALWRKIFSVKGESPEPVPVLPVLGEPIEAQYLNGWRNYEDSITSIGDATHPAQVLIGFANGSPGNMLAVLTRLEVFYIPATMGNPIKLGWSVTDVTNPTGKPRDFRLGLPSFTGQLMNRSLTTSTATYSVAVDVYPMGAPTATGTVHEVICCGDQIVIAGNSQRLVIASAANAETINVRYCWRERVMEPSEVNQS